MKKITMFLAGIFTAALSAFGQFNSLNIGMRLAEQGVSGYVFYASHSVEGWPEQAEMQGTISLQGWVTNLRIGDIDILEPGQKLPGIPLPESGIMRDVYFYIQAVGDDNQIVARGWASYEVLTAGQQIEVKLRLAEQAKSIKFTRPGQEGDVVFVDGNQIGYYDSYRKTFIIWPDVSESFGNHEYQIYDRDGNPVEIGQLDKDFNLVGGQDQTKQAGMSFQFEGGVEYLSPEKMNPNTDFVIDGQIALSEGEVVDAKVFVIDARATGGYVYVSGNYTEATFFVVEGETLYETARLVPQDESGWRWIHISPSNQRTLVVVRGEPGAEFYLSAGFYTGGGKG